MPSLVSIHGRSALSLREMQLRRGGSGGEGKKREGLLEKEGEETEWDEIYGRKIDFLK